MTRLKVGLCIISASLTLATCSPLSSFDSKHLTDSSKHQLPPKSQGLPPSSSNFNTRNNTRLSQRNSKEKTNSADDDSRGNKDLASIDDQMLQNPYFALNDSIDYDSMPQSEPQRLVPDIDYDSMDFDTAERLPSSSPAQLFQDLPFREKHERAQAMRITEIRRSILNKLRLSAPPNVTALKVKNKFRTYPDHIKPILEDQSLQQDDSHDETDEFHAKISTVIQFATEFPESKHPQRYPTESIAYFNLPLTVSGKNVQKATLMVYISTPSGAEGRHVQLLISETLYRHKPFINRTVNLTPRGHWEHIDITQAVADWATDESQNYGLFISAILDGKNTAYFYDDPDEIEKEKIILNGDIISRPHRTPLVKISLNEEQGRYKRSFDETPLSCDINDQNEKCCRYKFSIEFEQLGKDFDFIIEPRRFWANYCTGVCPKYYLPKDANSKLLMAFQKPNPQRCCTATSKKPLKLLYYNEDGAIMMGEIPDMTIEKCSCS